MSDHDFKLIPPIHSVTYGILLTRKFHGARTGNRTRAQKQGRNQLSYPATLTSINISRLQ